MIKIQIENRELINAVITYDNVPPSFWFVFVILAGTIYLPEDIQLLFGRLTGCTWVHHQRLQSLIMRGKELWNLGKKAFLMLVGLYLMVDLSMLLNRHYL